MIRQHPSPGALWLRLGVCVVLSAGLHAGLGAVGGISPEVHPRAVEPLDVALIEVPFAAPPPIAPDRAPSAGNRPAVRSLRSSSADSGDVAVQQPPEVQCLPPADLFAEDSATASPSITFASDAEAGGAADGESEQRSARGADASRGGEGGGMGLVRATPRYESNPLPNYPRLARQNRWEGTVRLRATITAAGEVESVTLERSSGHAVLDRSALDGVQRWRFIPATRAGVPVACEVSIPVAFRLTEQSRAGR